MAEKNVYLVLGLLGPDILIVSKNLDIGEKIRPDIHSDFRMNPTKAILEISPDELLPLNLRRKPNIRLIGGSIRWYQKVQLDLAV